MNHNKVKIAFFDAKIYDREFFDKENERYDFEIKYFAPRLNSDTVKLCDGFDVVCVFVNDEVNGEVIDRLNEFGIKLIALRCAGYNNVDLKAVKDIIHVVRVPKYSPHAIAEHSLALMLALNRKVHKAYNRVRDHNFSIAGLMGFDMNSKTAGIVGTGAIGKRTAEICRGFGMRVIAYDLYPDRSFSERAGVEYVDINCLYAESDIISLHCPLCKDNFHMIDENSISNMKDGAMIINTSRGQLIDAAALVEGLKSKKIGSAGLDVYEEESEYFFEDRSDEIIVDDLLARLTAFPNVIITSHQAFFTKEAVTNIAAATMRNINDYFTSEKLENEVIYNHQ
jgi:D-lactate dehydrogenase